MNDLLQQLLSMGPGIGAAIGGNGNAMAAFMDGYQKTMAQMQQQGRLTQQDQMAAEDRKRLIERQTTADANAAADRTRAGEVGKQQDFIRSQQAAGEVTQTAAGFEDPAQAKGYIESMMPNLMSVFGQGAMALGQPAVEQAQQVITGRQKKQVEQFVESALKVDHIANNPDSDPELTNLPAHIQKLIGKPSARLSELQAFAQLPVGKPQGKTRVPAMPGSQEDYIGKKYGENPTPEQILEGRRAYTDSGREPDKPNPNAGAYPPATQRRIDAIVKGFDSQPIVKRTQVMSEGVNFAQALQDNTTNPSDDQALIYAFAKVMDPDSVVREGEYATVQKYAQSWAERFGFDVKRIFSNTSFLTPEARKNMKATLMTKFGVERRAYDNLRNEYGRKIERITQKPGGIDELTDFGAAFPQESASKPGTGNREPGAGPKPGERRKFGSALGEWNGKEWIEVKP